jgi:uncharacterized protein
MATAKLIKPTDPRSRIAVVDAIRGFALFGVLLLNMYNFGAYSAEWTGWFDRISFTATHALIETKSWRLFSILFGFGFSLQLLKADTSGSLWFYIRRLVILFFIGMVHALIYDGDILMSYAMLGIVLIAFRKIKQRTLLYLAFILLAVFPVSNMIDSIQNPDPSDRTEAKISSAGLAGERIGHPYMGTVFDVFEENKLAIPPLIWKELDDAESHFAILAMFLLGLFIGRSGVFQNVREHLPLFRKVFIWGLGFGATTAIVEWALGHYLGYEVFRESTATIGVQLLGDTLFAYGTTSLSLAYAAGIVLLAQRAAWVPLLGLFENLGKMALTVYLSGTLMFTTLFYGYGFGQFNLIGPAGVSAYAILFFALQLAFCVWWLKWFRYGPVEWMWRSLTYLKVQPLRV